MSTHLECMPNLLEIRSILRNFPFLFKLFVLYKKVLLTCDNHHYVIFTSDFGWNWKNNEKISWKTMKSREKTTKSGRINELVCSCCSFNFDLVPYQWHYEKEKKKKSP